MVFIPPPPLPSDALPEQNGFAGFQKGCFLFTSSVASKLTLGILKVSFFELNTSRKVRKKLAHSIPEVTELPLKKC